MKLSLSKISCIAGFAALASTTAIGSAQAGTILDQTGSLDFNALGLTGSSVSCSDGSVAGATQCVGDFVTQKGNNDVTDGGANNPASKILATGVFGGITNWTFNAKLDPGQTGSNPLGFSVSSIGGTQGSFGFSSIDLSTTDLAFSLKGGPSYSIYYVPANSLSDPLNIVWNTLGIEKGNGKAGPGLSHASVYYANAGGIGGDGEAIPTPALLPGLIGLGAAALRKRGQTA